ncbi:MAG: integrase core domain-containing protein, partial [Pseudomonadota bacterium]|nr:integrase core domain-containing protein [Pseudomonadota bacterium]
RPSMGSVGDCFDNAMCESFFATLECELLDRSRFETQAEAKMALFAFIEGWYNPHRRHSSIAYLSPVTTRGGYVQHRTRNHRNARLESQAVNRPRNGGNSTARHP